MKTTEIFAHRGASGYESENTLEAFALAVEQGQMELNWMSSSAGMARW